jgi:hypothetical protein
MLPIRQPNLGLSQAKPEVEERLTAFQDVAPAY